MPPLKRLLSRLLPALLLLGGCSSIAFSTDWSQPSTLFTPPKGALGEASGIAASTLTRGLYWLHNDSGSGPSIYGFDEDGRFRGRIHIQGYSAEDWEDIASFTLEGKHYLLLADTGDNKANRPLLNLILIEEPPADKLSPQAEFNTEPACVISFCYPDGPRDVEAVGVDVSKATIYLLSKRNSPPRLYSLPLHTSGTHNLMAESLGELGWIPNPSLALNVVPTAKHHFPTYPTSLSFAPNGREAALLCYGTAWILTRVEGEPWNEAFTTPGDRLPDFNLLQAEGICFSSDSSRVLIVGEGKKVPVLCYKRLSP